MDEPVAQPPTDGGADPLERVVVQRLDGFEAALRRLEDGSMVLEGVDGQPLPALTPGERLRVTRPVVNDATYVQPARVLEVSGGDQRSSARIRPGGEAERSQQRHYVRVVTSPIELELLPTDATATAPRTGSLRDLSAGGVRALVTDDPGQRDEVGVGTRLRLRFSLPREAQPDLALDLRGEVVWAEPQDGGVAAVGVEFDGLDKQTAQKVTSWVFKQESRRSNR